MLIPGFLYILMRFMTISDRFMVSCLPLQSLHVLFHTGITALSMNLKKILKTILIASVLILIKLGIILREKVGAR